MRALRYPSLWLALGYGLVAGLVIVSLMPITPGAVSLDDKLLHLLAYLALGLWFGAIYRREHFAGIGLWLLLLGFLIECLQYATHYRRFELADIGADAMGILAGLLLAATPLGGALLRAERCLPHRD